MNRQDILIKLEEMKARINGLSASDKQFIENAYPIVKHQSFTRRNCGDCYKDAIIEMCVFLQKNEIMEKSNYILKYGVVLRMAKDKNVYVNSNLTDEIAEKYLKDNENRINLFSDYPEDWRDRIKPKESDENTQIVKSKKKRTKKNAD